MEVPQLTLTCHNDYRGEPIIKELIKAADGSGSASSPQIQFNISTTTPPGTIRVNKDINGIAIITITDGYTLTNPTAKFYGLGYAEGYADGVINSILEISSRQDRETPNKVVFTIYLLPQYIHIRGNVTLIFSVDFHKN